MENYFLNFVNILFTVLYVAIFLRILMSWVPIPQDHPIARVLIEITDPILQPLKRVIPPIGMFDISPMVALILLQFLQQVLVSGLRG